MGEANYRHQVLEALKANDTDQAIRLCAEWSKEHPQESQISPLYYLACLAQHSKYGNLKGVQFNLRKIVDILGE